MKIMSIKQKNLRQKLFILYHNDGILDIIVGIVILLLAAVMAFEVTAFIGLILIPISLYIPMKEKLSVPRMGQIRFESKENERKLMIFIVLIGIGALLLFVLSILFKPAVFSGLRDFINYYSVPIFALILGGALFVTGQVLKNARFILYSLMSLVLVFTAYFADIRVWIPETIISASMVSCGFYKLTNFLKAYPLKVGE